MKIGFLGDIHAAYVSKELEDITKIIKDYSNSSILKQLSNNFLNIGNLEAPITTSKQEIIKTGPPLQNPKEVIDLLQLSNVKCVTLANNHTYDYGKKGLKDTINICKQNTIKTVGAGFDKKTIYEPLFIEYDGLKIGIIAIAENEFNTIDFDKNNIGSNGLNIIEVFNQINNVNSKSDFTVLISHGGHEQYFYPSPRIKALYHFFIDIGVDAIIGHHPHVVQGIEEYKEKPIFYSTGNYFFPSVSKTKSNHEGFVVVLEFSKNKMEYEIIPYTQCLNGYKVDIITGNEKNIFQERLNVLSDVIQNNLELKKKWQEFIELRSDMYLQSFIPLPERIASRILKYSILRKLLPEKFFVRILNLIRCESHRDLLIHILKNKIYKN